MDPVIVLAYIALVLMVGILCTYVAKELKLPYNLILVLLGIFLGSLFYSGKPIISIDPSFIVGVGTLVLILLVFDSTSRLKLKENALEALPSIKFINLFTLLSVLIVGLFVSYTFFPAVTLTAVLYSLLFAVLVVETDLGSVLLLFKDFARERSKHVLLFLETEANLNTAFVIILPFIVLSIMRNVDYETQSLMVALVSRLPEFLYEILVAIGLGIIVGLIMLRLMRNWYDTHFSPIALVTACLVGYVFTTLLGGNGVIAVAVMGFFYGNVYVAGKEQLNEFSQMLSSALEIMVFVLLGMSVRLPVSFEYVVKTLLLFVVIIAVRLLAVFISLQKSKEFSIREKLFIGLNMPKGIALATVILVLSAYNVYGLNLVLQLAVMIMLYSIVSSFIMDFYAKPILAEDVTAAPARHSHHGINVLEMNVPNGLVHKKVRAVARPKRPAKKAPKKINAKAAAPAKKAAVVKKKPGKKKAKKGRKK